MNPTHTDRFYELTTRGSTWGYVERKTGLALSYLFHDLSHALAQKKRGKIQQRKPMAYLLDSPLEAVWTALTQIGTPHGFKALEGALERWRFTRYLLVVKYKWNRRYFEAIKTELARHTAQNGPIPPHISRLTSLLQQLLRAAPHNALRKGNQSPSSPK